MLKRQISKIVFYLVAVVLLIWTASLTVSFIQSALPNAFWAVPYLGLVVFDGGMVAWMFVFLSHAQGAIQRATALILCVFNLLGVGLMVVAEIMLGGQTLVAAPESLGVMATWGIGIWTIVNVAGLVLFHLGDPEAQKEMAIQTEKDAIFSGALTNMKNRRVAQQAMLADELGGGIYAELLADVRRDSDRDGTPDIMQRGAQSGPRTVPPPPPAQVTAADVAAFLSLAQQSDIGNSTYDAPRQAAAHERDDNGGPRPVIGGGGDGPRPDFS
jgi:hypothetical protein